MYMIEKCIKPMQYLCLHKHFYDRNPAPARLRHAYTVEILLLRCTQLHRVIDYNFLPHYFSEKFHCVD